MTSPRRIVTLLAAGSAISIAALLFASPIPQSGNSAHDSPAIESHSNIARNLFTPREQSGLVFLLQSISTNASMNANPSCPCGYTSYRNLSFNGHISNPMGNYAYRVSKVHLDAFDDAMGNSLLGRGNINVNPQPHGPKPFVAAQKPGQTVYSYFNANMQIQGGMGLHPDRIAATIEVEIAKAVDIVKLDRTPMKDAITIAPGMEFRLHTFNIASNGTLQVAFNYRIDQEADIVPAFLRFEILDPIGNPLLRADTANETVTTTSIIGAYNNTISLGNQEIGSIRIHVVREIETVIFNFDQSGLSKLGL